MFHRLARLKQSCCRLSHVLSRQRRQSTINQARANITLSLRPRPAEYLETVSECLQGRLPRLCLKHKDKPAEVQIPAARPMFRYACTCRHRLAAGSHVLLHVSAKSFGFKDITCIWQLACLFTHLHVMTLLSPDSNTCCRLHTTQLRTLRQ